MKFSKELMDGAKACKNEEELLTLAKENGLEMTEEDAAILMEEFREGELADDELDSVAGGGGCFAENAYNVVVYNTEAEVQYIFNEGAQVEAFADGCSHHTATCKVVSRDTEAVMSGNQVKGYKDIYWLEKLPGVKSVFIKGWCDRSCIEK